MNTETHTTASPLQLIKYSLVGFLVGATAIGITLAIAHRAYADPDALGMARQTVSLNWDKLDEIKRHCSYIIEVADGVKKENERAAQLIDSQGGPKE